MVHLLMFRADTNVNCFEESGTVFGANTPLKTKLKSDDT
jgi:hypothetical protein